MSRADEILVFWFGADPVTVQSRQQLWFSANPTFDQLCTEHFAADHEAAAAGRFENWKGHPRSCLALVLLLDQFPRNMFRRTARAFATDLQALDTARHVIASGFDRNLPAVQRAFVYFPFEHSEALADQAESVRLTAELAQENPDCSVFLKYAELHCEVIRRFGRFPHRNSVLGRASTAEETEFLRNNSMF
jgi:uncharacterized protein (DUF924 family)